MKRNLLYIFFICLLGSTAMAGDHFGNASPSGGGETLVLEDIIQDGGEDERLMLSVFPNPFNQSATIRVNVADKKLTELKVYDLIGKEIHRVDLTNKEGMLNYRFNFSELRPGIYFCSLYGPEGVLETKKMVKMQ